jgi:biotin carboxylase
MQMPAIRGARERGWRVVVADGSPDAAARRMCDRFELVDLKDRDGMAALAGRVSAEDGLDGVFTAGTDFSTTVAWVAERLGLPGIPYSAAMAATDKDLMRRTLRAAGVPCPLSIQWSGRGDPVEEAKAAGVGMPAVVKPVDNMGARGVRMVRRVEELAPACASAAAASRTGRALIEQYMEGPELSMDALVWQGEITLCGVADRDIRFNPCFVEMGHTMPSARPTAELAAAEEVFRAGVRALGIAQGAAKGDVKLTQRGPMIGEIAARLSGGYMSGWTFPLSTGVDVTGAALNIAVGLPPGDLTQRLGRVAAERAFISIPGEVEALEGVQEARSTPEVEEVFTRTGAGEKVRFPTNNVEKCGNVIACSQTRDAAEGAARQALECIRIRLQPLRAETDEFLYGSDRTGDRPWAYTLGGTRAKAGLEGMPLIQGSVDGGGLRLPLPVLALPGLEEEVCLDWHGLPIRKAIASLVHDGLIRLLPHTDNGAVLGRLFWQAVLRGGRQGGEYAARSAVCCAAAGQLSAFLARACGD